MPNCDAYRFRRGGPWRRGVHHPDPLEGHLLLLLLLGRGGVHVGRDHLRRQRVPPPLQFGQRALQLQLRHGVQLGLLLRQGTLRLREEPNYDVYAFAC